MKNICGAGFIMACLVMSVVRSLEHYNRFREGSCSGIRMQPIKNLNRRFIDSVEPYIPAGSKYHFYRIASNYHRYREMKEHEFFYDFCLHRNMSSTLPVAESIAFGRVVATHDVNVPRDPSVYLELNPRAPQHRGDILRQWVTLTDNKSFVFITMCWTGVDQKAWVVFSSKPVLDPQTERIVTGHAIQLGFRRENALFIRYDSCRRRNPFLDYRPNNHNNYDNNNFQNNYNNNNLNSALINYPSQNFNNQNFQNQNYLNQNYHQNQNYQQNQNYHQNHLQNLNYNQNHLQNQNYHQNQNHHQNHLQNPNFQQNQNHHQNHLQNPNYHQNQNYHHNQNHLQHQLQNQNYHQNSNHHHQNHFHNQNYHQNQNYQQLQNYRNPYIEARNVQSSDSFISESKGQRVSSGKVKWEE